MVLNNGTVDTGEAETEGILAPGWEFAERC